MATKPIRSARLRTWVIVSLSLLLLGLGSMLFYTSYRSQVRMQETMLGRWRHDTERRAAAFSYFYTERLNELSSLAANSTITSFFLNKSLGMSMRYGLRSTLNNIESLFGRLIETHCLDGKHIYQGFALLDHTGELLSVSLDNQSEVSTDRSWSKYLTPQTKTVSIIAQKRQTGGVEVFISAPIFLNQVYSGQLLAWIDFPQVYKSFINVISDRDRSACVVNREGLHFCDRQDGLKMKNCSHDGTFPDGVIQVSAPADGRVGDLLVLRWAVADTPFFLVETVSKSSLDYLSPQKFIAYLSLFAVAILVISGLLLRYLFVHARLEEVVRRENEVAEKNLLLEKEITERLRSETELAESRQRLKLALQGADLGLWDWDVITGKVIFNERLTEMVGYRVDELEPHVNTWENLIHPDDLEEAKGKLMAHLRGETEFFESEHRARHKNGKWLWIMDRGAVVKRDGDGHPLRAAGTHLDITHRKKAEQDLLAAHDKLESRVEERTRELREAQAELINRALEEGRAQLAAMVLHNIGNAITPVSIYLEQAQSTRMQELCRFQQRCFAELKKNSENLTDYIAQDPRGREIYATLEELIETLPKDLAEQQVLLDKIGVTVNHVGEIISLQQSYAGVGQEIKETVDLNSLIRDALRLQEDSISKRDIVVSTNLSPESPRLLIDKNRLNQVLVNLIKNSCEAIEENETSGARNLSIETCLAGDLVRITITDSGIGVSPDKLDKIFNFGESGKGSSGFGLHYCKMFIEANRGKISLSSLGIGQGASFSINLPLVEGLGRGNDGK